MDNLCHTLIGAALGEAGLKRTTRFGNATLMIASNLPDVDVLVFATATPSVAFRKDACLEHEHPRAVPPCLARQPGFQAGVLEERLAVPSELSGDLRQQESARSSVLDDNPVLPDGYFVDGCNRTLGCQERNLDLQQRQFVL